MKDIYSVWTYRNREQTKWNEEIEIRSEAQ
jgi:hypothetical protein